MRRAIGCLSRLLRLAQHRALEAVEVMNLYIPPGNLPYAIAPFHVIRVGRTDKGGCGTVYQHARAIDIATGDSMVFIIEGDHMIGGNVLAHTPGGPKYVVERGQNTGVTLKTAEGWTNIPHAVAPPDREESILISLIEAVTIIGGQIFDCLSALHPIQPQLPITVRHPVSPR